MTPEQKARLEIDKRLAASGWLVQDKNEFNPAAALGGNDHRMTRMNANEES